MSTNATQILIDGIQDAVFPNDSLISTNWTEDVPGCSTWKKPNHVLFQVANGILLLGLLSPECWKHGVLFLHSTFVIGFMLLSSWAWVIFCAPDFFSWNFAFMVINIIQMLFLLYHIRPIKFQEDLEQLYNAMFQPMQVSSSVVYSLLPKDIPFIEHIYIHLLLWCSEIFCKTISAYSFIRRLFKKLVHPNFCSISYLHEGDAYAVQSVSKTDRLGILLTGTMKIYSHQNLLHLVHEKEFIDSPEFESSVSGDEKYQVSIIAETHCCYVYWPRQSLEYLLMKEPYLATVLNTIMGRDITNKLYALNERVKVPTLFAARQDIRLPSVAAHRKVNQDLRKALAHVNSDSVKNAAKSQGMNMVTFEEDEKETDEVYTAQEEQIDLLNGHVIQKVRGRNSRFSSTTNSSPARSDQSEVSGIHFNI